MAIAAASRHTSMQATRGGLTVVRRKVAVNNKRKSAEPYDLGQKVEGSNPATRIKITCLSPCISCYSFYAELKEKNK